MQSNVSPSVRQPNECLDTTLTPDQVIAIVKNVRDKYAPEVFPESSVVAQHICGEIIGDIKRVAGGGSS